MKMKITKHTYVAVNVVRSVSYSTKDHSGAVFEQFCSISRVIEKDAPTLLVWQVHVLWVYVSFWKTNCAPQIHEWHTDGN